MSAYAANPRDIPAPLLGVCIGLIAVGLVAFALGDAATVWRAYHVNFLYFGTFAQAALVLSGALVIVGARWAGPVRFVAEGFAAWVPISFVLFLVGNYFGGEYVHQNWIHGAPYPKEEWLTFGRVYSVDGAVMLWMTLLTLVYLKASFRPSLKSAADGSPRA